MTTIDNYGKLPPQALEIEEAVLGALMLESEAFYRVSDILTENSFYKESHQIIFRAIKEINKQNNPIDLLTVTNELKNKNQLETIGGPVYISTLTTKVAAASHIEHHARIIQQKYMQRELIRISDNLLKQAYDETCIIEDSINYGINEIMLIGDTGNSDGKFTSEVCAETLDNIEEKVKAVEQGKTSGIPTGFVTLDKMTGGFKSPNFIIVGARPAVGKTTQALHYAIHAAKAGFWVNLYTYEMTSTDLFEITMAGHTNVNRSHIRDGNLSHYDFDLINKLVPEIKDLPIIWYDNSSIKSSVIRSNSHKNNRLGKCDIVIIDYLQLMPPDDNKLIREQQISQISRTLKGITTGVKIPVIALSQLNREVESRKSPEPYTSDLRESGSLEQDADIILLPYVIKDDIDQVQERWVKIAKNRRGKIGQFEIWDDGQMTKLTDISPDEFRNLQSLKESKPF